MGPGLAMGVGDPLKTHPSPAWVSMPNLTAVGPTVRPLAGKHGFLASCYLGSLEIIESDKDRSGTHNFRSSYGSI